jgi:hypothetical protein
VPVAVIENTVAEAIAARELDPIDVAGGAAVILARRRVPRLKVVYMTGYARNATVHHGVLDAGVDLLPKPFTTEGLGRKLQEVLRRD